ncbi:MAG: hypothetical protein EBR82_42785 [Caulobacteraceae bacterium]|nr:hypothetical protein [Caulobacteraceae bacterium]
MSTQILADLIIANNLTGTAAEVLTALTTPSVNKTRSTPIGPALLYKHVGLQTAEAACQVFEGAAAQSALFRRIQDAFSAYGLDFSDDDTRAQVDTIFTGDYAAIGTALKAIGVYQVSLVADRGLDDPSEADVTAALDEVDRRNSLSRMSRAITAAGHAIDTRQATTWEQVVAAFAAAE